MSENNINISPNIINNLKEELLHYIRQIEKNLQEQINQKYLQLETNNNSLIEKFNLIKENNEQILATLALQKLKLEKLSDYVTFKKKIESMTTTHEIRINSIIDDVFNFKIKYGKIITDNLVVPGFIGQSCQFKTISDYLLNQILESSKTKNEKEQIKSDIKECKNKVEGFLKTMVNLNDTTFRKSNNYIDGKIISIKEYINKIIENFEKNNLDMKVVFYEKQQKMFEQIKNEMKEVEDILV